jgi:hypothetical protein
MTDEPIWPGVTDPSYHAARLAAVVMDGTWMLPSGFSPRCSSREWTLIAGMSRETGAERGSDGPRPAPLVTPAADRDGCGA